MAKQLVAPSNKRVVLGPVHPNQGVEAAYRKRLERYVDLMHRSLLHWLRAAYNANEPEIAALNRDVVAQDASPAAELAAVMRRLTRRWQRAFNALAPELSRYFATEATERSDAALREMLRKGGFSVRFKMTDAANDTFSAVVNENVGLIKSIAAEHLQDVQGLVMRSVARGRDLSTLTQEIEHRYGLTRRRAAFIARDQNNKATGLITSVRQRELGIRTAIWIHSGGGRVPRPSHVKAGKDKLEYDVTKGAFIDGAYIYPGELPNCRCVCRAVVEGFD